MKEIWFCSCIAMTSKGIKEVLEFWSCWVSLLVKNDMNVGTSVLPSLQCLSLFVLHG
jgi:hypothetical protein